MLRVARATDDQLAQLRGRIRGRAASLSGEVVVTTVEIVAPSLIPALSSFRVSQPEVRVRVEVSDRVFHLEYGEAHVAVRAGREPTDPDNVVESYGAMESALFAHPDYLAERGVPDGVDALRKHDVVADADASASLSFTRWIHAHVGIDRIVFGSANERINLLALRLGLGIGFCPVDLGRGWGLEMVIPPRRAWATPLWLVTHVDLHRSPKVQAMLRALRQAKQTPQEAPDAS